MKKITICFLISVFFPMLVHAQGTLYVSNLDQIPIGSAPVASNLWVAQAFSLGFANDPSSNILNSIQLLMNDASGIPSGFTVSVFSSANNGSPASLLGVLDGSTHPSTAGMYTYSTPGIIIFPGKTYFIVVTAMTSGLQGAYTWSAANTFTQTGNTGWIIEDVYYSSANGTSWTEHLRENVFQMAIYATPIPEPASLALLLVGMGLLGQLKKPRKVPTGLSVAGLGMIMIKRKRNGGKLVLFFGFILLVIAVNSYVFKLSL